MNANKTDSHGSSRENPSYPRSSVFYFFFLYATLVQVLPFHWITELLPFCTTCAV
jgi:hypothetical protein